MKYVKNFEVNEGIGTQLRKLGGGDRENTKGLFLGRATDDLAAKKIIKEIKKDFEKYNRDLRKVKIFAGNSFIYYMGKYHKINNSPGSGNFPDDRHQKIIEFHYWDRKGLEENWGRIKIETITPNDDPDTGNSIDRNDESYKISTDIAKKIYDFFNDEYEKQYPQLKNAKYKNHDQIRDLKKGKKPVLGYLHEDDPNGKNITYDYNNIEDIKKVKNYIKHNIILTGKNHKRHHITYFTSPNESEDLVRDNIMNMEQVDVNKQNMERVYNYNK